MAGDLDSSVTRALSGGNARDVDDALAALARCPVPDGVTARRAFFINVYNVLSRSANRGREGDSVLDVMRRLRRSYRVAAHELSCDDVEHGILRDDARHPALFVRAFGPRDPRRSLSVPLDARIHFAIHCGAVSCPRVRVYDAGALDAQLDAAEHTFLSGESRIDEANRTVETSKILDWYSSDFGGRGGVLSRIGRVLERDLSAYRLSFARYDWSFARG